MQKEFTESTILVAGSGTMGSSIAQVLAAKGIRVYMSARHESSLKKGKAKIRQAIAGMKENGLIEGDAYQDTVFKNLHVISTDRIPEIAGSLDLVFEAIAEDADSKRAFYRMLNENCRRDCIFASNTSGMDIFSVTADILDDPGRLIITHWFNPPHLMKLIEVVRGEHTSDETTETVCGLLRFLDKKPAVLNHFIPGFIVNRIATVICRELYYMIDQGWVSGEDAENAIRYTDGLRYGFEGPLALWDFVGLKTTATVAKGILPTLCDDTDGIRLAERLLQEGKTGVAAGEGILKYPDPQAYQTMREERIVQMTKILNEWDREDLQRKK